MITIYDLNRNPKAILENATNIGYEKTTNELATADFVIKHNDPKASKIDELHFAEIIDDRTDEYIGLFRIMPKTHSFAAGVNDLNVELYHVLGTLIGKTLFKYHQFTNFTTREVLERLLNMQHTKHWVLGDCEFTRRFHYSFENENLLSAIFSIPTAFDEPYEWVTDTTVYPWVLHLRKPEVNVSSRIIQGYNLKGFKMESNPNALWNRIYPLGAGEGVNQVDIKKVNNNIAYLENTASIAKYGIYETTWVDKRFTDAATLKASAQALLDKWSEPIITWETDVLDVSSATGIESDKIRQGKVCRIQLEDYPDSIDLRVIKETKSDINGDPSNLKVTLGNLTDDLGTTQADLERRQQINELYSQGATNILNYGYQDNCDNNIPALIPFYIDDDVVNVNTIELTFRTKKFRAYSGVTEGGGGTVKSTTSGGGTTATSSSGGGVSKSTAGGGGTSQTSTVNGQSTQTSSANGSHRHVMFQTTSNAPIEGIGVNATTAGGVVIGLTSNTPTMTNIETLSAADNHSHTVNTPAHSHDITIPSHTHEFNTPNHTHSVVIPNHSHDVDIPAHTHEIKHEIVEDSETASSVVIEIDGNTVPHTSISGNRINLVDYIEKDSSGKITRGRHEITIKPNRNARIEADVTLRVFIQSQLGGQF